MAYTKQTWVNGSGGATPVNATRLGYIETGLEAAATDADTAEADSTTALANAATAQGDATTALSDAAAAQATADVAIAETVVDAVGDLLVATAADTVARLPIGTDERLLQADSGQASGLKWGRKITVAASAPAGPQLGDLWLQPIV